MVSGVGVDRRRALVLWGVVVAGAAVGERRFSLVPAQTYVAVIGLGVIVKEPGLFSRLPGIFSGDRWVELSLAGRSGGGCVWPPVRLVVYGTFVDIKCKKLIQPWVSESIFASRSSGGVPGRRWGPLMRASVGAGFGRRFLGGARSAGDGKGSGLRSGRFGCGTLHIPDAFQLGKFGSVRVPADGSLLLRSAYR